MITHVAIKDANGKVWSLPTPPNRHGHIYLDRKAKLSHLSPDERRELLHNEVQGFLNDKGEFLDRRRAYIEALKCNQIRPMCGVDPKHAAPRELFSEDIF